MVAAIGMETGKVYITGMDKEECFRGLSELYPSSRREKGERGTPITTKIYPEPLRIVRCR